MKLTLPIPPSVNSYMKYKIQRNGRRLAIKTYPSLETESFYSYSIPLIKEKMEEANFAKVEKGKFVSVTCTFYFEKKGKDADNHFKCIMDAIQKAGLVENDSQLIPRVENVYVDKENPRVEIVVESMSKMGVFLNESHMEHFKQSNCCLCKKNPNRCATFTGFLDNRVHNMYALNMCKNLQEK